MLMFVRWRTRTVLGQWWDSEDPSSSKKCCQSVTLLLLVVWLAGTDWDNKNYDKKIDRKQKNLQNKGRKRPQVQQPQQSALNKTKLKCGYGIKKTFNILRLLHINLAVLSGDLRGIWPGWRVCVFIQPETLSSCSKWGQNYLIISGWDMFAVLEGNQLALCAHPKFLSRLSFSSFSKRFMKQL